MNLAAHREQIRNDIADQAVCVFQEGDVPYTKTRIGVMDHLNNPRMLAITLYNSIQQDLELPDVVHKLRQ